MNMKDLITVNQAARQKGVSRQTIHAAIKSNRLDAVTETRVVYRVSAADVDRLEINAKAVAAGRKKQPR